MCRFISSDDSDIIDGGNDHVLENNLFIYCFNNPLNLADDDGSWPSWATKVAIGAAVIATAAIVTVATGGAGAGVAGFIAAGALKGAAIGGAVGAATGAAGGAISHRVSSGSWKGAGNAALEGGASGFMSGAITGAITGGISRSVQVAKAAKAWSPGTGKSRFSSMKYHYNKHAVKEGFFKNNNIVKYTKDALKFSRNNKSVMKYTYNHKYGNASWYFNYIKGSGGYYTSSGKILSFWYR